MNDGWRPELRVASRVAVCGMKKLYEESER